MFPFSISDQSPKYLSLIYLLHEPQPPLPPGDVVGAAVGAAVGAGVGLLILQEPVQ